MVNGDAATGVELVYELVHFGAFGSGLPSAEERITGVTSGPVGEPE